MIAEVIVDIAASETDKIYDYLCDENVVAGSRVRAPFGGKTVPGFVMRIKESSDYPAEKLKKVFPAPDELPALNPECLALAEKLTARYRVPKALALRLFLPTEMRTGKVRELMNNYAELCVPLSEIKLPKTAKNQLGAAEYLAQKRVPRRRSGSGKERVRQARERTATSRPVQDLGYGRFVAYPHARPKTGGGDHRNGRTHGAAFTRGDGER